MSRNIVRHLRFSKSEYEAIGRKASYLKIPEGRFIVSANQSPNTPKIEPDKTSGSK